MFDDLVGQILGEAAFGRLSTSRRAQVLARLFFGLLGTGLGLAGGVYMAGRSDLTSNLGLRGAVVATFFFLACFWLFNVALGRRWRWPGLGFIASLVAMFIVRIAVGP